MARCIVTGGLLLLGYACHPDCFASYTHRGWEEHEKMEECDEEEF